MTVLLLVWTDINNAYMNKKLIFVVMNGVDDLSNFLTAGPPGSPKMSKKINNTGTPTSYG